MLTYQQFTGGSIGVQMVLLSIASEVSELKFQTLLQGLKTLGLKGDDLWVYYKEKSGLAANPHGEADFQKFILAVLADAAAKGATEDPAMFAAIETISNGPDVMAKILQDLEASKTAPNFAVFKECLKILNLPQRTLWLYYRQKCGLVEDPDKTPNVEAFYQAVIADGMKKKRESKKARRGHWY